MLQQAFAALIAGNPELAERLAAPLLKVEPDHEDAGLLLGICAEMLGRTNEALTRFQRLTVLYPATSAHWSNLGNIHRKLGQLNEARAAYERAIELDPIESNALLNLGSLDLDNGRFLSAKDYLLRANQANPQDPATRSQAANACYECGDQDQAEALLQHWAQWAAGDALTLAEIAWTFVRVGDAADAERALDMASNLLPGHPRIVARRAAFYERTNRLEEAAAELQRMDIAAAVAEGLAEEVAVVRALIAARDTTPEDALQQHEAILANPQAAKRQIHLHFSLGRLYDRSGDPAMAMKWLAQGHSLQMEQLRAGAPELCSPDADPLDITRHRMSGLDVSGWVEASSPTAIESPIFVLGFPRSGTTLLETMLDAHPQLTCMDERAFLQDVVMDMRDQGMRYPADLGSADATAVQRMRRVYWNLVQTRAKVPAGRRLVDKNPLNMLRLPLIRRMFPNAKIVLALRHPCDVVLSNYMQMFRSPAYVALCATVDTIATGYARAFDFWNDQSAVLNPDVLQIRHEDIVDDVEGTSRRLTEFLGIAWDPQMVAFHDRAKDRGFIATPSYHQVIEPINRKGVGRWERYQDYFGAALPRLQPFLDRWGYGT